MIEDYHGEKPSELIEEALRNVKIGISTNMDRLNRKASGNSVRKLRVVIDGDNHGYLEGPKYPFVVLERGRGPNKTSFARRGSGNGNRNGFIESIRKWIIDKGIPIHTDTSRGYNPNAFTNQVRQMAGAIAYSIAKNGTKLHRTKSFNDIFTTNINKEINKLDKKLGWWFQFEIDKIMQKEK